MIAIVHHGGCPDGVAAAWVAWTWYRSTYTRGIQIIPASYGMPLPEFTERPELVYVLDFSWPYEQMVELAGRCEKLVLLDHHQTALDNISEGLGWGPAEAGSNVLPPDAPFAGVLDNSRSGAMITWDYFHPTESAGVPAMIEYVQDRDLWRWELPHSREVGSLILTMGETVEGVDRFMRLSPSSLLAEATGAHAFEQAAIRSALKSARWCAMTAPDGERREFPMFPSPYILGSTGCEQLMEIAGCDMAGYWINRSDGATQYGFRSRNGTTVHDWAKKFGGGGHPQASGCQIPFGGPGMRVNLGPVEGV